MPGENVFKSSLLKHMHIFMADQIAFGYSVHKHVITCHGCQFRSLCLKQQHVMLALSV